jgi:hypothetical protein
VFIGANTPAFVLAINCTSGLGERIARRVENTVNFSQFRPYLAGYSLRCYNSALSVTEALAAIGTKRILVLDGAFPPHDLPLHVSIGVYFAGIPQRLFSFKVSSQRYTRTLVIFNLVTHSMTGQSYIVRV